MRCGAIINSAVRKWEIANGKPGVKWNAKLTLITILFEYHQGWQKFPAEWNLIN